MLCIKSKSSNTNIKLSIKYKEKINMILQLILTSEFIDNLYTIVGTH